MKPCNAADQRAERDARRPGRRSRCTGWFEAEVERVRDPLGLDHRHRVAEEAEQRPDRQVDVARHDDQHHAGGHDRDRGALDRQVPQVARRSGSRRPTAMLKPIQMTASATTMPSRRVSISRRRERQRPRLDAGDGAATRLASSRRLPPQSSSRLSSPSSAWPTATCPSRATSRRRAHVATC